MTPYDELADTTMDGFFYNPELGLHMDDSQFGGAVPAMAGLRIQRSSLASFDFGNTMDGLFPLKGSAAVAGTALNPQPTMTETPNAPGRIHKKLTPSTPVRSFQNAINTATIIPAADPQNVPARVANGTNIAIKNR